MKMRFKEGFSASGLYYEPGQVAELDPSVAATIPEGVAEQVEEEPPEVPPDVPPPPPPKGSKT